MAKFEVGDVVELKSGSPKMTVRKYTLDNLVVCDWFDGNTEKVKPFPEESLQKAENGSTSDYVTGNPYPTS